MLPLHAGFFDSPFIGDLKAPLALGEVAGPTGRSPGDRQIWFPNLSLLLKGLLTLGKSSDLAEPRCPLWKVVIRIYTCGEKYLLGLSDVQYISIRNCSSSPLCFVH